MPKKEPTTLAKMTNREFEIKKMDYIHYEDHRRGYAKEMYLNGHLKDIFIFIFTLFMLFFTVLFKDTPVRDLLQFLATIQIVYIVILHEIATWGFSWAVGAMDRKEKFEKAKYSETIKFMNNAINGIFILTALIFLFSL